MNEKGCAGAFCAVGLQGPGTANASSVFASLSLGHCYCPSSSHSHDSEQNSHAGDGTEKNEQW